MRAKRKIEIFSAGCAAGDDTVAMVRRIACSSCEIEVLNMHDPAVAAKAKNYGVRTVPAVEVDGRLAACCVGSGPDEASLRAAGVGVALPYGHCDARSNDRPTRRAGSRESRDCQVL
jgi:glutaredoxin 3